MTVQIPLRGRATGQFALVEDRDAEWALTHLWYLSHTRGKGYAFRTTGEGSSFFMHREIIAPGDSSLVVDHINGNKLDNRRSNLRAITQAENVESHFGPRRRAAIDKHSDEVVQLYRTLNNGVRVAETLGISSGLVFAILRERLTELDLHRVHARKVTKPRVSEAEVIASLRAAYEILGPAPMAHLDYSALAKERGWVSHQTASGFLPSYFQYERYAVSTTTLPSAATVRNRCGNWIPILEEIVALATESAVAA